MRKLTLAILALVLSLVACKKDCVVKKEVITYDWYSLLGSDTSTPNFPDYYANYFIYNFDRTQFPEIGLRIDGEFGDARYMSYNVYNFGTGLGQSTLVDFNIVPNSCSNNPYQTTQNPDLDSNRYTIYVVSESDRESVEDKVDNLMTFPDDVDTVSVFFRYYVPVGDPYGSVDLPKVSAFFPAKLKPEDAPPQIAENFGERTGELIEQVEAFLAVQIDTLLRFYNLDAGGLYTNLDATYLATPVTVQQDEVYLFRFKAPTYAQSPADYDNAEVRYWSINIGDDSTRTRYAIKDDDAIIAADGFANFVIAEDNPTNRARAAGLNFIPMPVDTGRSIGIIYRNLITQEGFAGDINNVPTLDTTPINVLLLDGPKFIGDYAPRGVRISTQQYLNDFGGFEVSY